MLTDATEDDRLLMGHLLLTAKRIAVEEGIGEAYRLNINNGAGAGQTVFHLHVHLLGGRSFTWASG